MSQHDDLDGEEIRNMWWEQGEAVMREMCEEDYNLKEPLIKDPKIRKAVKAWAELSSNGIVFYEGADGYTSIGRLKAYQSNFVAVFDLGGIKISYELEDNKQYTIEELCGKED